MIFSYYPTVDDTKALHAFVMEGLGRAPEVLTERAKLESALQRPRTAAEYVDADLAMQTARLMHGIATAHRFPDGNKRTAVIVGDTFIQNNGYWLSIHQIEFAYQLLATTKHTISEEDFAQWMRERLLPIEERDPPITERVTYEFTIELTDKRWGTEPRPEFEGKTAGQMREQFQSVVESSWTTPVSIKYMDLPEPDEVRIFIFDEPEIGLYECKAIGRPLSQDTDRKRHGARTQSPPNRTPKRKRKPKGTATRGGSRPPRRTRR